MPDPPPKRTENELGGAEELERRLEAFHEHLIRSPDVVPYPQPFGDLDDSPLWGPATDALRLIERVRRGATEGQQPPCNDRIDDESMPLLPLPEQIGRFEIIRKLGEGGHGIVLLAFDPQLKRKVALKVPRPEALLAGEFRARFMREAEAAAILHHPNLVPVYEVGSAGPVLYIAAPFIDGTTLAHYLAAREEPLGFDDAARLCLTLADAVQHAHSRGVLHRDLKPANVLLDGGRSDGVPDAAVDLAAMARISDFGLAKLADGNDQQTRTGTLVGTPSYMAPEQAEGLKDSTKPTADIYALGAILYELLAGKPPFKEGSVLATLQAAREKPPVALRKLRPSIPRDLEAICLRCLEKDPARRFDSAAAMADDLQRFLDRQPVRTRSISSFEHFTRWFQRNPIVAALTLVAVLLAICSVVASVLLAQSRRQAVDHLAEALVAKEQARKNALTANVTLAQAARRTGRMSHRTKSWMALDAAVQLASQDEFSRRALELRNDAAAVACLTDLVADKRWPAPERGETFFDTDAECRRFVRTDGSTIVLHAMESGEEIHRLAPAHKPIRYIGFRFSPDGKFLGARYESSPRREMLELWDLEAQLSLGRIGIGGFGSAADFSPKSDYLVAADDQALTIRVLALPTLSPKTKHVLGGRPGTLIHHPSRPVYACFLQTGQLEIRDVEHGEVLKSRSIDSYLYALAWSPDGRWFATAGRDGTVAVYQGDVDQPGHLLKPVWQRYAHASMAMHLAWHPDSLLFASSSTDGTTYVWDADSGSELVVADGWMTRFSQDGTWLGHNEGRWKLIRDSSYRVARQPDRSVNPIFSAGLTSRPGVTSEINHWEAFPKGRLVIGQNFFGAVFRDVTSARELADVPLNGCGLRFTPDGENLIAVSLRGIDRLPVEMDERADAIEITIGPPQHTQSVRPGIFAVGPDDRLLLVSFLQPPRLLDWKKGVPVMSVPAAHAMAFWCDISPSGEYFVTGTLKGRDVEVRGSDGALLKKIPAATACPWFSPDGRLLAVAEIGRFTFYEVGSWRRIHEMKTIARGIWPSSIAFSSKGECVAVEDGSRIRLLSTDDFSSIVDLEVPTHQIIESIRFSRNDRNLIAGGGDQNNTHVWDLKRINDQLRGLKLNWLDPSVDTQPADDKPIRLRLQLGGLSGAK